MLGSLLLLAALGASSCKGVRDDSESDPDASDSVDTAVDGTVDGTEDGGIDGTSDGHTDGGEACVRVEWPRERPHSSQVPQFSLRRDTILDEHLFLTLSPELDPLGYGGGGALWDFDGDGLIDAFLGRVHESGTPPCLYRNVSNGSVTSFERFQCFSDLAIVHGARVTDWDGDGRTELMVYGPDAVTELSYDNGRITRRTLITLEDMPDDCSFSDVLATADGLLIARGVSPQAYGDSSPSRAKVCPPALLTDVDGDVDVVAWSVAPLASVILTLGRADIDQDGVLDTMLVVDTYSSESTKNTQLHPGGYLRDEAFGGSGAARFSPWILSSTRAWGSFMGGAQLVLRGALYTMLTDWGAPLLLDVATDSDAIDAIGVNLSGPPFPFSWSAIVADFNGDLRDDLVLTRGTVHATSLATEPAADMFLLQTEDGSFSDRTDAAGLVAHPPAFDADAGPRHLSRAGTVTDFDRDGRLELLILPYRGRPLLYESDLATHCLASVSSAYARPHDDAYGWAWLDPDEIAHPLHVDAHTRLGESRWLPLPAGNGVLRAPSSARVAYRCEPGDRIELSEPIWAEVTAEGVTIDLCVAGFDAEQLAVIHDADGTVLEPTASDGDSEGMYRGASGSVTIRVDGRFALRCGPAAGCER